MECSASITHSASIQNDKSQHKLYDCDDMKNGIIYDETTKLAPKTESSLSISHTFLLRIHVNT